MICDFCDTLFPNAYSYAVLNYVCLPVYSRTRLFGGQSQSFSASAIYRVGCQVFLSNVSI